MTFKIEFHTSDYERSHGRKPNGRGGWAFIVMTGDRETVFVPGSMTLEAAKSWMRSYCLKHYGDLPQGGVDVEVAP